MEHFRHLGFLLLYQPISEKSRGELRIKETIFYQGYNPVLGVKSLRKGVFA